MAITKWAVDERSRRVANERNKSGHAFNSLRLAQLEIRNILINKYQSGPDLWLHSLLQPRSFQIPVLPPMLPRLSDLLLLWQLPSF
jgi:hypothetical protein